jgi:hypothetical protein
MPDNLEIVVTVGGDTSKLVVPLYYSLDDFMGDKQEWKEYILDEVEEARKKYIKISYEVVGVD